MTCLQDYIDAENAKTQKWLDENPGAWAGFIPDADHWAESYDIHTVAEYEQFQMDVTYSDLYKEVYGCRPRNHSGHVTPEEYDSLLAAHERHMEDCRAEEVIAIEAFERLVNRTIDYGAGDRETAIAWLKDAEGDNPYGDDYFEYTYDLPYGYLKNPKLRG